MSSGSQELLFSPATGRPAAPAADATRATLSVEVVTLPLPGGRVLRLARVDDALMVCDGFRDDHALRAIARSLEIPLELWPAVRAELDRLAGT
jgi:hypothetical protein